MLRTAALAWLVLSAGLPVDARAQEVFDWGARIERPWRVGISVGSIVFGPDANSAGVQDYLEAYGYEGRVGLDVALEGFYSALSWLDVGLVVGYDYARWVGSDEQGRALTLHLPRVAGVLQLGKRAFDATDGSYEGGFGVQLEGGAVFGLTTLGDQRESGVGWSVSAGITLQIALSRAVLLDLRAAYLVTGREDIGPRSLPWGLGGIRLNVGVSFVP